MELKSFKKNKQKKTHQLDANTNQKGVHFNVSQFNNKEVYQDTYHYNQSQYFTLPLKITLQLKLKKFF